MGAHQAGIDLDRSAIAIGANREAPALEERIGEIDLQSGGAGCKLHRLATCCCGRLQPSHPTPYRAGIGMCLGAARIEAGGAFAMRNRRRQIALIAEHQPEIAVGGGEIGPQGEGATIAGGSFGKPAGGAQGVAEIGMALREVGCSGHCLADQLDRLIRIAPRRGDHTEQMEGIRISRRLPQKLLVERLGALEPSSPMVFEGDSQFGGGHRVSPLIHAITGASHATSIPPSVP
jgi:hypothetical protein